MTGRAMLDRMVAKKGEASAGDLIRQVGDRVREAREEKRMSRRVLSEISGVSPRYLAQLEAGEGNISIGLLQRVAEALGRRIEWFVGADAPGAAEAARVAELFLGADAASQARVLRVLDPKATRAQKAGRICLVGLRGAGKSTLGSALGKKAHIPFIELNREIEDMAGMPVGEIIALYGQEGYRQLEADALTRVVETHSRLVLAVAGGVVSDPVTFGRLLARFHTVWVKATPAEHMERVRAQGDMRPMAGNPAAMAQLRSILTNREALYEQAELHLDTSGRTVDQSLGDLVRIVEENEILH